MQAGGRCSPARLSDQLRDRRPGSLLRSIQSIEQTKLYFGVYIWSSDTADPWRTRHCMERLTSCHSQVCINMVLADSSKGSAGAR